MKRILNVQGYTLTTLLLLLLCSCNKYEQAPNPPKMWGNLEQGTYAVGFKTLFIYDQSRPAIPYSDWDGKLFPIAETVGRQMQLNIWYPSNTTSKSERLLFEHYVNLLGQQTNFGELDENKIAFASQEFVKRINAIGGTDFSISDLDSLKELQTHAFLNADPVQGKFPLVVFPNGSSPAFQSILCEYLASHGFIVATVALKGVNAFTEEASFRGVEMAMIDLDFAIRNLLEIPQVNKEKIGLIGNAITSSQVVAYQNRNSTIDCIISLEGGLLSSFEQNILDKTAFYDIEAVDIPILALYAPHPAINPSYIFDLKYSDRYFYHFPQMTEFHFLNFGQFERFIPNIIGEHDGNVQKGHELACLYSLKFLEAILNDNQDSKEFINHHPSSDMENHIDTSFVKSAIPKVPHSTNIKNAYSSTGFRYIDSLYTKHKKVDPKPFSQKFYSDMKDWLAWQKDPEFRERYQLYKLAYDSYPNSAEVNYYLSYFALQTSNHEESRFHIAKALTILEKKEDPELTIDRSEKLKIGLIQIQAMLPK
jgi:dienelactone hydrolase